MQLSDAMGACGGAGPPTTVGAESCRFPKLEECAHFHYERVQLPKLDVKLENEMDKSLHSQHTISSLDDPADHYTLQVTCREECWLIQRTFDNFAMLDAQLHQCIYDRKVSQLCDLSDTPEDEGIVQLLSVYLERLCSIIDNSLNCGPILNWFQLDNRGHRLLVPSEESRSINTPAVAAAYSVRKYVSQARDELSLEVGDMISVIDMANPGESVWWRGKRGFQVGFFPQHCVHIIGDKVPRNMPLPPPVVGSLAISPIKPVLRKHGKLITFFRSFILNRPSRRRLKQSGILKERVFGCDLGEHLLNSGHEIPMVLKCCAEFIETHGIVDGIYRLSGVTSNIQKLRNAFDEDRIPNLYTDDILQDIHSVASLLKMYFRELPNPLCTYQLYHSFVAAVQGCSASRNKANDNERLLKMREAVQKLPPPHYRTLEYLMRHLSRIAAHGARTGMTTRNVAIVWAPNLLRCEELEIGGVAALQGVGVQAVVTEFLVCYADLIFAERLPPALEEGLTRLSNVERELQVSPKRSRPKSLALSTPTKLLTLEEARNKHLLNKSDDGNYIEVGGGPKTLPKKYHTVIELPAGSRKRGLAKRSPSGGWRSFFSKSRNSSHGNLSKREISSPGIIPIDKSITESDLNEIKRKLRPVKSAESLTSGHSEPPTSDADILGPLHSLQKSNGHNRSVSHDSYFDNLQTSQNNSIGSLLDLSEIQLNFELEESEMRIFSEDESLVSSPKVQKESITRKSHTKTRFDDNYSNYTNSSNPSPKKQPRVVLSPDSLSRKRSRLEDQFSDIQYIDCNTPENPCIISTTAQIHQNQEQEHQKKEVFEGYQPKNKSPRNRYSLNFEKVDNPKLPKSLTDTDFKTTSKSQSFNLTPQTPNYKPLDSTETTNTPVFSPENFDDLDETYTNLTRVSNHIEELYDTPASPNYENILTTISIVYKSPAKSENIYEDIELNPEQAEKAVIPTTAASLPSQEASQPQPIEDEIESPKLLLETTFDSSITTISHPEDLIDHSTQIDTSTNDLSELEPKSSSSTNDLSELEPKSSSSTNDLSELEPKSSSTTSSCHDHKLSNCTTQLSHLEITESPTDQNSSQNNKTIADKRKSCDAELIDENTIYQQVKYFRRSIHEINQLLIEEPQLQEKTQDSVEFDSLEPDNIHLYENVGVSKREDTSESTNMQRVPDLSRIRMHENTPKKLEITDQLPVCAKCSDGELIDHLIDNPPNEQIGNVRSLTNKFEAKPDPSTQKIVKQHNYEKDNLPPCLRAKNAKNSIKTRSLDENAFVTEFGSSNPNLQRRKSLDDRTSSYILVDSSTKLSSVSTSNIPQDSKHARPSPENIIGSEQKLNRERIEKYKEERRNFWREKYRSESFKEDKDKLLLRLKQKSFKTSKTDVNEVKLEPETKKLTNEVFSKFEQSDRGGGGAINKSRVSPHFERKHRPSLKELSDKILDDTTDELSLLRGGKEDEFLRHRRGDGESERRRHTYDIVREGRDSEDRDRRVSLDNKNHRKEKCSPSYCIKDMKAIFESKSQQ